MSLETINYIGETEAVVAILASLIFVGLQFRQSAEQTRLNTLADKAAASFDATHSWASTNEHITNWGEAELISAVATYDPSRN